MPAADAVAGPADAPAVEISKIDERLRGACAVKGIRWDKDAFLARFLEGCTRSEEQQHQIDLRTGSKKRWVVYPEGVFERPNKPERFRETAEDKTYSPYQSTSLVTDKVRSRVFGHGKTREKYLVGVVIPLEHTKPGSGMVYDGGTVGRPFDFDTREEAEAYWRQKTDPNNPILFANLADLATELEKPEHKDHYNEVLAKLRWSTDGSCKVGIFSDTLEARLVAQWYAKKLRDHLRAKAKENGEPWDVNYQVPICIYLPEQQIYFADYTLESQQADIAAAMSILNDRDEFNKKVAQNDYEFLLAPLLHGLDISMICRQEIKGTPLLYRLLNAGKYQLLEALLEQDFNKASRQIQWEREYQQYLFIAAEKGHHHIIRWLCRIGADINAENSSGKTTFSIALEKHHYNAQMACLEARGFDLMALDSYGNKTILMFAAQYQPTVVVPILDFITTHANRLGDDIIRNFILQGSNALMLAAEYQPTAVVPILDFIITHEAILNDEQLTYLLYSEKIKIPICNILKQKLNSQITNPDRENIFRGFPLMIRLAKASIGRDVLHKIYIDAVNENSANNPARSRELLEHALQTNNPLGCFFANHRGPGFFARGDTVSQAVSQAALRAALERLPIEATSISIAYI